LRSSWRCSWRRHPFSRPSHRPPRRKAKQKQADAEKAKKLKAADAAKRIKAKQAAADKVKKQKIAAGRDAAKAKLKVARRECGSLFRCIFGGRRTSNSTVGLFQSRGESGARSRKVVDWTEAKYTPGSIVVRTPERALYLVLEDGEAMRYAIGVGREGFQWSGNSRIDRKQEWPDWHPPEEMIRREHAKGHMIPDFMEGGPGNPLGARAMYIGGTIYRIHGTNNAASIGQAMSSGCFRMLNADVIDLYERVNVGARVYVYQ
jgi:lipoprotein-anchoring transpeptidase ErfK/SrfK